MSSLLLLPDLNWRNALLDGEPGGGRPSKAIVHFDPVERDVEPGPGIHETQVWACPECWEERNYFDGKNAARKQIVHLIYCPYWALALRLDGKSLPLSRARLFQVLVDSGLKKPDFKDEFALVQAAVERGLGTVVEIP